MTAKTGVRIQEESLLLESSRRHIISMHLPQVWYGDEKGDKATREAAAQSHRRSGGKRTRNRRVVDSAGTTTDGDGCIRLVGNRYGTVAGGTPAVRTGQD